MRNIITFFSSIIISIFFVEIIIRIFFPFPLSGSWRIQDENGLLLNKNNIRTKHEYFTKEEKIKVNYTFGEFNNRTYQSLIKKNNNKKILILGDSFTFGWLLKDEDTFIYKYAKERSDYFVINSAAGGWGTSDFLSYLENYCLNIKPEKVIIFINNTDHERAVRSKLYFLDEYNNLKSGANKLSIKKIYINKIPFYNYLIENSQILQLIRMIINKNNFDAQKNFRTNNTNENFDFKKNIELIKKIYKKLNDDAKNCNTNLHFVNLSWPFDVSNNHFKKINKEIFSYLEQEFSYYSFKNEIKIVKNKLHLYEIPEDKHPNKKGNELFFNLLLKTGL